MGPAADLAVASEHTSRALEHLKQADDEYVRRRALSYAASCVGGLVIRMERYQSSEGLTAAAKREKLKCEILPRFDVILMAVGEDEERESIAKSRDFVEKAVRCLEGGGESEEIRAKKGPKKENQSEDGSSSPFNLAADGRNPKLVLEFARRPSFFSVDMGLVEPESLTEEIYESNQYVPKGVSDLFLLRPHKGDAALETSNGYHLIDKADPFSASTLCDFVNNQFNARTGKRVCKEDRCTKESGAAQKGEKFSKVDRVAVNEHSRSVEEDLLREEEDPWQLYSLGLRLFAREDFSNARCAFKKAYRIKPSEPEFLLRHWLCEAALARNSRPPVPYPDSADLLTCQGLCRAECHPHNYVCQLCHESLCEWGIKIGNLSIAEEAAQHLLHSHKVLAADSPELSASLRQLNCVSLIRGSVI